MNTFFVDFAKCVHGHYSPIRPSSLLPPGTDQQWTEKDDGPVAFACNECRRVYSVNADELQSLPTGSGVGPYNPNSPIRVFQVPIECDALDCSAQLLVHVVLKSNTTAEQLLEQTRTWRYVDVKCPGGHEYPHPQWK